MEFSVGVEVEGSFSVEVEVEVGSSVEVGLGNRWVPPEPKGHVGALQAALEAGSGRGRDGCPMCRPRAPGSIVVVVVVVAEAGTEPK